MAVSPAVWNVLMCWKPVFVSVFCIAWVSLALPLAWALSALARSAGFLMTGRFFSRSAVMAEVFENLFLCVATAGL